MIAEFPKNLIRVGLLLTPLAFVPNALSAQEPEAAAEEHEACVATVDVASVSIGADATEVTFSFSEEFGEVTGIEGAESGLQLASDDDLAKTEMANAETPPAPIEMSSEAAGTAVIWLNTLNAQPGTHEVYLVSEHGKCTAEITVGEPS